MRSGKRWASNLDFLEVSPRDQEKGFKLKLESRSKDYQIDRNHIKRLDRREKVRNESEKYRKASVSAAL